MVLEWINAVTMQSMEILGRIKSYLEKSGKRSYPGVR